jgi:hypothetical protein
MLAHASDTKKCQLQTGETYFRWCHTNAGNSGKDWEDCKYASFPTQALCDVNKEDARKLMGFYWIISIVWGLLLLILSSLVFGTAFLMKGITPEVGGNTVANSTPVPQPVTVEATAVVVDAIPVDVGELHKELQR